ncbi:tetratricopeptide repeat protein [Azospira oryzae PS]|uniref:Tetratricopeptide repeat protein n=1 Tax=Azospira oryzae (strain ATCC BAA-33 / DSM 13638 / PS) TaxID=640081 RepID=G8QFU7_AZOOP|nr:tetratricopeptide repeat protein [Azospira oryzae]AEV24968.1 tetratricopeptide repeat protein [Azospira oryzae PS]
MTLPPISASAAARAERRYHQGIACLEAGQGEEAEAHLRQALALAPQLTRARANLGYVLEERGAWAEAEAAYRRALAEDPGLGPVWLNLGGLLLSRGRAEEALPVCLQTLSLLPGAAAAWVNLGAACICLEDFAQGERCLLKALSLEPDRPSAHINLAYLLLRQGRYEAGWECFEARPWYRELAAHAHCPRWHGEAPAGRHLLVLCEAGHGDMIQFCRYLPLLRARGARLSLVCQPALVRLFAALPGVERVIPLADLPAARGDWDAWVPLMSLPRHFATRVDSIPAALPYLQVGAPERQAWRLRLPAAGLRVGLAWRGNPRFENDGERSLPGLWTLAPLAAVPGIALVSLQKGEAEEEALWTPAGMRIAALGSELTDFADTAALIANLDLVIAVDTAVAHLAAALGVACWLLLPRYKTDWRWLEGRQDSPWYPGVMRLFRQERRGDWDEVVSRVAGELAAWADGATPDSGTPALEVGAHGEGA